MIVLRETTVWRENTPNHVYALEGDKLIAYQKSGKGAPIYLKHPLPFNKRYRTFVELKKHPFKQVDTSNIVKVKGSKGNTYEVDLTEKTCTCPGFIYHKGNCKHLKELGL